jgi:predicted nicotinamide N-methyase
MPHSAHWGKAWTRTTLIAVHTDHPLERILDIGAGSGTYVRLLRSDLGGFWTAVEIWPPYVAEFDLNSLYDDIWVTDVRDLALIENSFDLVLMGDVVEHMTKEEAVAVVDHMLVASHFVLISIPIIHYPQGAVGGNPYEAHVKDDWSHTEVLTTFPHVVDYHMEGELGVYLLTMSSNGI